MESPKKVLLLIDGSYLSYVVIFRAFEQWKKMYSAFDTIVLPNPNEITEDTVLPDILVESKYFEKTLNDAVDDKLSAISWLVQKQTGLYYPSLFVDTVFARDFRGGKQNFRYGIYPEYKLKRKIAHKTQYQFQVRPVFDFLYRKTFPNYFPQNTSVVQAEGAEGDDVIATLVSSPKIAEEYKYVILIASDRDFLQLQSKYQVRQFDVAGKPIVPKLNGKKYENVDLTPAQALAIKILSGDGSDNIPAIKAGIGEIKAYKLITEDQNKLRELMADPLVAQRFHINKQIIDFNNIPQELKDSIMSQFNEARSHGE